MDLGTAVPVPVSGGPFSTVSAGFEFTCGITPNRALYCWGVGAHGQLGNGSTSDQASPTPVGGGLAFAAVAAGGVHACGLTVQGVIYCWGYGAFGQLGNSSFSDSSTPVRVSSP